MATHFPYPLHKAITTQDTPQLTTPYDEADAPPFGININSVGQPSGNIPTLTIGGNSHGTLALNFDLAPLTGTWPTGMAQLEVNGNVFISDRSNASAFKNSTLLEVDGSKTAKAAYIAGETWVDGKDKQYAVRIDAPNVVKAALYVDGATQLHGGSTDVTLRIDGGSQQALYVDGATQLKRVNPAISPPANPSRALEVHGDAAILSKDVNPTMDPPTLLVAGTLKVTRRFMLGDMFDDGGEIQLSHSAHEKLKGDKGDKGSPGADGRNGEPGGTGPAGKFEKDDSSPNPLGYINPEDYFKMRNEDIGTKRWFQVDVQDYPDGRNRVKPVVEVKGSFIGLLAKGQLPKGKINRNYLGSIGGRQTRAKHIIVGAPPYAPSMYGLVIQDRADFVSLFLASGLSNKSERPRGPRTDAVLAWGNDKNDNLVLRFMGRRGRKLGKPIDDDKDTPGIDPAPDTKHNRNRPEQKRGPVRNVVVVSPRGRVKVTGTVMALGYQELSDGRLKESVEPIPRALDLVDALQGVTYKWKGKKFPFNQSKGARQIGLVAQDVERICPEVVSTDEKGFKSIDYGRLTPVLIEALKEQQKIIDNQRTRLERVEAALERIGALPPTASTSAPSEQSPARARSSSKRSAKSRADRPARGTRQ